MRVRPALRRLRQTLKTSGPRSIAIGGALGALGALVWASVVHVGPWVASHPYFQLRTVRVACDLEGVDARALASRAGLYDDTTLWEVDPQASMRSLQEISWVASARVWRRFPAEVNIDVTSRRPRAATLVEGRSYFVDDDGAVFRLPGRQGHPDLPYLTGWYDERRPGESRNRLRRLLEIMDYAEAEGLVVSQVDRDPLGVHWLIPVDPAVAVRLGSEPDPSRQLRQLEVAVARLGGGTTAAASIDVSSPDRIVLKAAGGRMDELVAAAAVRQSAAAEAAMEAGRG